MTRYAIFDKKCVGKKGLNKCFLRSTKTKKQAKIYASNSPKDYIIKKITEKEYKQMAK